MEGLAVILFIILMIVSASDKKKKKGNAATKAGTAARTRAGQPGQPNGMPRETEQARPAGPATSVSREFEGALARLRQRMEEADAAFRPDAPVTPRRPEPVARAVDPRAVRQGESMLADDDCHGGSMAHTHDEGHSALADEDCVGGSMAHTHTEGVSRADHARCMAAIDANHDDGDALSGAIDARALRRAVVMAEVLGKPRALRR